MGFVAALKFENKKSVTRFDSLDFPHEMKII